MAKPKPKKPQEPRDDDYPDIVPDDTRGDLALEAASLFSNFVPGIGGALASVFSSWSTERKRDRVSEVISGLALRLANLRAEVHDEYVRSDEFVDLLDQTLRRVVSERHEEKRRLYRESLVGALTTPNVHYDERLRILRVLDELQVAHIKLLRAIMQEPAGKTDFRVRGNTWLNVLQNRLKDMPAAQIEDLFDQLKDLRVIGRGTSTLRTFTAPGTAEDVRKTITPFGQHFVEFIRNAEGEQG